MSKTKMVFINLKTCLKELNYLRKILLICVNVDKNLRAVENKA